MAGRRDFKRNCDACEVEPLNRIPWHCEGGGRYEIYGKPHQITFDRCPCSYIDDEISHLFWLARQFRAGQQIMRGGILDWPNKFVEVLKAIEFYTILATPKPPKTRPPRTPRGRK